MTIATHWQQLPRTIDHAGYTFQLEYRKFAACWYIGYFVSQCNSRKRDKKTAFSLGYWTDKRPSLHTSSVGTPLLTGVPMFTDDNEELAHSLQTLHRYLVEKFGYTSPITAANAIVDAEFEEIAARRLPLKSSI
jgi:hypothetical protein